MLRKLYIATIRSDPHFCHFSRFWTLPECLLLSSMADHHRHEGSSSSNMSSGNSESTLELNLKTLDSQIYGLHANKNMLVSSFKEKIAGQIGVPVEQQRLIFRGKVLKDEHLLSEYNLENGDTLHLVVRQASQLHSSSSPNFGEVNMNNGGRGQEPGTGAMRNRVGQISHSVVLGTFNVGEQGDGIVPDLGRVIGAVLNSIGIGNQNGSQPGVQLNAQVQPPQRSGPEGTRNDASTQSQAGNQSQPGQPFSGQSLPQVVQIPLGAAIAIPSLNMPIPDSLNTLLEFMNRMELALSQHGNQSTQSPHVAVDPPTAELPSNSRGVSTPEALRIILQHAQHLLGGPAVESLSRIAGRLEQDARSGDPTVRGQIQTEAAQVGMAMQHLGALLLELGRTMLTLRMGQSPAESSVNAGPAVYISPAGPNPIMVQPFPLQASSLFASSSPNPSNTGTLGPVAVGNIPRNVNIHIHAGSSMAPYVSGVGARTTGGEGPQGEQANTTVSGDSGQSRAQPVGNVATAAIPLRPAAIAVSGTLEPTIGVSLPPTDSFPVSVVSATLEPTIGISQPPSDSFPLPVAISEVSSQLRSFVDIMRNELQSSAGQADSSTVQGEPIGTGEGNNDRNRHPGTSCSNNDGLSKPLPGVHKMEEHAGAPNSKSESSDSLVGGLQQSTMSKSGNGEGSSGSCQRDASDGSSAVPLGLGFGGLQPKRRNRLSKSQSKTGGGSSAPSGQTAPVVVGQHVLQSLATRNNPNIKPPGQVPHSSRGSEGSSQTREQNSSGQFDAANAMSQVLQSPALDGLLAGVSQQTGIGSPDALRNMLGQFTQNPAMRNTVNQLAQQMESNDLGNMFASAGGGQGGGFDFSRMLQQMMPIVSQALGSVSTSSSPMPSLRPDHIGSRSRSDGTTVNETSQAGLQEVAQRIEQQSPPGEIFNSLVRNVAHSYEGSISQESIVNMLSNDMGLTADFVEMLHRDVSRRLDEETKP